jgi:Flp pilus assembly protein TadD
LIIRTAKTALLIPVLLAGCVHHRSVQDFGLSGQGPRRSKASSSPSPLSVRSVLRHQVQGAFNPLADDQRVVSLRDRLSADPSDVEARLELAAVYENYRLYPDALQQYTAAFELVRSEKSVLGIARCDQALNRTWQAIPLLEQFLKESPSAGIWNALGLLHGATGNLSAAETAFRAAAKVDPASDRWRNNLGYNLLLQGKLDAAETELRKAVELNPESAAAHNNLAAVFARRGDLRTAFEELRSVVDEPTAHNNLAVILMEAGQFEQSRQELVKALALKRNFAPALSNFKLVQERMRRQAAQKQAQPPSGDARLASVKPEAASLNQPEDKQ